MKREDLDKYGSYGVVYRVTLAAGHLEGYDKVRQSCWRGVQTTQLAQTVVAEKRIRAKNDRSGGEWRKLYREVETLQKRRHLSIIPLLASYYLETVESGDELKTLHLIFPWAEMDLASWMVGPHVPGNLEECTRKERQAYLYRSICTLVSGVSYLHRAIGGTVTAHHDLKPRNILLVDGELKIADLGRSHLRPIIEGSATEGASELGTYEYQPPEYWKGDGSRAQMRHGRAFDVWAMACIIIELATLIVHDWKSQKVSKFKDKRKKNPAKERKSPESVGQSDRCFFPQQFRRGYGVGRTTEIS